MVLASGSSVALRYTFQPTQNVVPAGLTAVGNNAASSTGTGLSSFTRAANTYITDGYAVGQKVLTAGFTNPTNNGSWTVAAVTAGTLTVIDVNDVIVTEASAAGNTTQIQMRRLRATGRNINLEKNLLESAEVDADGQDTDVRHGFNRVTGSFGFQLSHVDFEDMFQVAMQSVYANVATVTPGNLGSETAGGAGFLRTTGSFITDGFRVGDRIRTSGYAANNNGDWTVIGVVALKLTVYDPLSVITTEAAAGSRAIIYPGRRIDVGTTMRRLFVERAFLDVLQFQKFLDVGIDQMQLNLQPEAMVGGSVGVLGMSALAMSGTPASAVAAADSSGNAPMDSFTGLIFEGGSNIAVATSLNLTLARNLSLNPVIGSRFSPDLFRGQASGNGTMVAYFENATYFNKFQNETESTIAFSLPDPNNPLHFIGVTIPRVKYVGAQMDPPKDGPVPLEMPLRMLKKTGLASAGGSTMNSMLTIQVSSNQG